eukprot:gene6538-biopygen2433
MVSGESAQLSGRARAHPRQLHCPIKHHTVPILCILEDGAAVPDALSLDLCHVGDNLRGEVKHSALQTRHSTRRGSRPESSWNRSCRSRAFPHTDGEARNRHYVRKTKGHLKVWKGWSAAVSGEMLSHRGVWVVWLHPAFWQEVETWIG